MALRKLFIVILAAGLGLSGAARAELIDAVVATVDREVILHSDIITEIRPLVEGMDPQSPQFQEIYAEALDQAIDQKILYREGVLNDIKITDDQLDLRIQRYRDQFENEEQFLKALEEAGETISDFRERVRKQTVALSMGLSKRRLLERDVVISEAELAQYYQDHIEEFQKPERVKLYRIFVAAEDAPADRAKALAQVQALREELSLGAEFTQLASNHSEGPGADQGGFVGWIERGELIPELEEVAFSLEPGDVSPIIETEFGVMLLKAEEKVEAGLASFDEVRTELEPELRREQAGERYERWMSELRKRSRVRKYQ